MQNPIYCNQIAFDLFVSQIQQLETNTGICNAVTAIAMHFDRQISPQVVASELDEISNQVRNRVVSGSPRALTARLHQVLFDELGFRGNTENFFDPKNSFLPSVLESKRGIPITLALVYKLVAERCGLDVVGLNTPGHFLVCLNIKNERMIVDCFCGGELLSVQEVSVRNMKLTGCQQLADSAVLKAATHRQWVARILANLIHTFSLENRPDDIAAVSELYDVLKVAY
jgi:regulator of sirC expression with transglutaminase-like and TPR domain